MEEVLDDVLVEDRNEMGPLATQGQRLANLLVDSICQYIIIFGVTFGLIAIEREDILEGLESSLTLIAILITVFYYTFLEYFFGKSVGKFLTKTHVVKESGERPSFMNLVGRNLCRHIPFDAFSFLFSERGWHDTISSTYVVRD